MKELISSSINLRKNSMKFGSFASCEAFGKVYRPPFDDMALLTDYATQWYRSMAQPVYITLGLEPPPLQFCEVLSKGAKPRREKEKRKKSVKFNKNHKFYIPFYLKIQNFLSIEGGGLRLPNPQFFVIFFLFFSTSTTTTPA